MTRRLMFFIDFDGTISRGDICGLMLDKYAGEDWRRFDRQWQKGDLTTEECARLVMDQLTASPAELEEFFSLATIDETFLDFVLWAGEHEYPLYILSDGYDNYIAPILQRYHLKIPFYANHLAYRQGWEIDCLNRAGECRRHGVCKTDLMEALLLPGFRSVYIGDGHSDCCPVEKADLVFAKDDLARLCSEKGITYRAYENFADIVKLLALDANKSK